MKATARQDSSKPESFQEVFQIRSQKRHLRQQHDQPVYQSTHKMGQIPEKGNIGV